MEQKKNTHRIERVNSLIQQQVGISMLQYLKDLDGVVTISKIETSRDLKWAKVWVSIVGGNDEQILKTLNDNIYEIQGDLNRTLAMKIIPRLQFFLDTSPRYVQHIDELIKKVHEEEARED